jgi:hypothetical protein
MQEDLCTPRPRSRHESEVDQYVARVSKGCQLQHRRYFASEKLMLWHDEQFARRTLAMKTGSVVDKTISPAAP